jgi:dsRNA-specific ribonuclease
VSEEDPTNGSHETHYTSHVLLENKELGIGKGHTKKDAEQNAAEKALNSISQ